MRRVHLIYAAIMTLCLTAPAIAQTGRVGGVVKDTDGSPIKGATIRAVNPNATPSQFSATTDDRGRFSMIGLRSGIWRFICEAPGFMPQEGAAPVRTIGAPNPPLEFTLARGAMAAPSVLSREVQTDLNTAESLRNAGRFDEAVMVYQSIRAKNPTLTMVNMVLGGTYRQQAAKEADKAAKQAAYTQAIAAYQEMLKADPSNERAKIEIAMTNLEASNFDAAEQALTPLAASTSATREVFYNLGEIKFAKGEMTEAEAMFKRAADVDPTWQRPKLKLGLVALKKGDKEAAIRIFEEVVAADPAASDAAEANAFLKELRN